MYPPRTAVETFQIGFARNPRTDFEVYARGYFDAAEHLVKCALAKPSFPDYDAYPIMFLYRQAVELDLKACIYNSSLLGFLMEKPELDHSLMNEHHLPKLANRVKGITDVLFDTDQALFAFMSQVVSEVNHISTVDPQSFAFRYPVKRDGTPSFTQPESFGLQSTQEKVHFLHNGLQAIHFGIQVPEVQWLELYEILTNSEC